MERSRAAVTTNSCGGGQRGRPPAFPLGRILIVFACFVSPAYSQTSDFLIVKNTDRLVIYDSFQQSLPATQKPAIAPFAPMKILAQRDLLGDGLTPCMKVEVDGDVFFLLREESGRLAGWNNLGYVRTFQHKEFVGDTVEVIEPDRTRLENPEKNGTVRLLKADELIRYFEDGNSWYVRKPGMQPSYGWAILPLRERGTAWQIVRSRAVPVGLSQMLRDRIVARISALNESFVQVYRVLGKETGKNVPAPRWSVDSSGSVLSCVLQPATAVRFYPKTIDELSAELQAYVAGTGYAVSVSDNRIEISRE